MTEEVSRTYLESAILCLIQRKLSKEKQDSLSFSNDYFIKCIKEITGKEVPKSSISDTIASLEKKGWISREYKKPLRKIGGMIRTIKLLKELSSCNILDDIDNNF